MPKQVVVLSQHSLLADGIVSQLREHAQFFNVVVLDIFDVHNITAKLLDANPEIIIVDAIDEKSVTIISVASLLRLLPMAKIIYLKCNSDKIQVFMSEQWRIQESSSLFSILEDAVAL